MQTQACDRCHRRKTKCDRRVPRCGSCEKANAPCVHTDKLNLLPYPRAYIDSLESTIKRLETENKRLKRELKTTSSASSPACTLLSVTADENASHGEGTSTSDEHVNAASDDNVTAAVSQLAPKPRVEEHRHPAWGSHVPLASLVYSLVGGGTLSYLPKNHHQNTRNSQFPIQSPHALPSREEAFHAIEAYFNHWHLTFPILSRPQFLRTVDQIYSEANFYTENPFQAFLFDIVLGMGSTNFNRQDRFPTSPETHYVRAISKLDKVFSVQGLASLQSILFLCQYSIFCTLRDTSANMWQLVGIATRLCTEMGLHRRSKQEESVAQGLQGGKVILELEIRKRTFWCLYNLDRIISVTLGRPVALHDEDIDITLPTALDIDEFSLDELTQGVTTERLRKTSPFLHLIFIRRLVGKILQNVHCRTDRSLSREEKYQIQQSFHDALQSWKSEIADIDVFSNKDKHSTSSFRSATWYEVPYHNALLLLFRPSPTFAHTGSMSDNVADDLLSTLNNILSSAISVIRLYAELHQTRRLNYSWITLHAVFMAGLSYVYSISRIIKETKRRGTSFPPSVEYTQIIDVTRICSKVLVAINEQWATARGSCEIFGHLSNAIIQDAVKAQLNSHKPAELPLNYNDNTTRGAFAAPPRGADVRSPHPGHPHHHQQQPNNTDTNLTTHYPGMESRMSKNPAMYSATSDPFQTSIAENGFRQCYNSLQGGAPASLRDPSLVPSEVMMGFSQDWFAGDSMLSVQDPGSAEMIDIWGMMDIFPSADQFQ